MPERNPAAFAAVGSVPIRALARVSELVEIRIARSLAERRSKSDGPDQELIDPNDPLLTRTRYSMI